MTNWKETLKCWVFSLTKVPLIICCLPRINHIDAQACKLTIPLNYLTKNHLKAMYLGSLMIGADLASGFLTLYISKLSDKPVKLVFKSSHAKYLRRAHSDVTFECNDGPLIHQFIDTCMSQQKRVHTAITVTATDKDQEVVATFSMELSIKPR